jgi:hypothetical protein
MTTSSMPEKTIGKLNILNTAGDENQLSTAGYEDSGPQGSVMDKSRLSNDLTFIESGIGASFFNDKSLRLRKSRGAYRRKH